MRLKKLIKTLKDRYKDTHDPYSIGLLNGVILAQATLDERVPVFIADRKKMLKTIETTHEKNVF